MINRVRFILHYFWEAFIFSGYILLRSKNMNSKGVNPQNCLTSRPCSKVVNTTETHTVLNPGQGINVSVLSLLGVKRWHLCRCPLTNGHWKYGYPPANARQQVPWIGEKIDCSFLKVYNFLVNNFIFVQYIHHNKDAENLYLFEVKSLFPLYRYCRYYR